MTKDDAGKLIAVLFASFPSANLERKHVDAYVSAILDLDAKVAGEAVSRLRNTATFLPAIAEIRRAAADVQLGPMRSGEDAYRVLLEAVRAHGWPTMPRFRDPHILKGIGVWGSWQDLCNSPADDPGGRARFIELYEQSARQEREDVVAGKPLPAARASKREFAAFRAPRITDRSERQPGAACVERQPATWNNEPKRLSAADIDAEMARRDANG